MIGKTLGLAPLPTFTDWVPTWVATVPLINNRMVPIGKNGGRYRELSSDFTPILRGVGLILLVDLVTDLVRNIRYPVRNRNGAGYDWCPGNRASHSPVRCLQ